MRNTSAIVLVIISVLLSAGSTNIAADTEENDFMINIDARKHTSLNGTWHIIADPFQTGYYSYRYRVRQDGYFKNDKPDDKTDLVEYDFDSGETLKVPGDWNTQNDKYFLYEGTMWYKRDFDYKLDSDKRLFVYFGGANYHTIVYLNGEKLGEHTGGFTPFQFEITDKIKDKDNFLIVKVDNKRKPQAVPTMNFDWWNYGGITRRVMLLETPKTFIEDYFVQLAKGKADKVSGWVQLDGAAGKEPVKIEIPEADIEKTFETDAEGYTKVEFEAEWQLWSPENPKLYDVIVSCDTDRVKDKIGFRTVETKGDKIVLNGEPVFLRGISIHEESPFRASRANSSDEAKVLLGWAKELGCNYVRLAHYPHNEAMVRMADKMGLLVWSEIPVYWTIAWENEETYENAENQLSEMINRDKNRASVILWSVANETPVSKARMEFLTNLIKKARRLDSTRLITAANERHQEGEKVIVDDPLGKHLDVLGCNEYYGWYLGLPEICDNLNWKVELDKPLIISEFGGGALYGKHGDKRTRWSEEYQADIYTHQIPMLKEIDSLAGMSPWILKDFLSPRRPLPVIQDFYNRKGLISDRGQKKKAFYVLRNFYRKIADKNNPLPDQTKEK